MKKASILAVGTELTQGQITNRNATWLSDRLTSLGYDVRVHAVVPDDRNDISTLLDFLAARTDLIVVTGGLGPTSDDFTRDVLADWLGRPLVFIEKSWEKIVRRLTERGIEVAESNRSQCYFPEGAKVLENQEGTADGFSFQHGGGSEKRTEVLVLPGPPREGMHLWERFAEEWLREKFGIQIPDEMESWNCLGKSESSLGEIVEAAVAGFGVQTGYRATVPYVEVKVWLPSGYPREKRLALLAKLNAELAPYSVSRNGEDLGEKFLSAIELKTGHLGITVLDLGTEGILTERLLLLLKTEKGRALQSRVELLTRYAPTATAEELPESASEWILALFPDGKVAAIGPKGRTILSLPTPYAAPSMIDRLRRYRTELALQAWTQFLNQADQSH